jgi:adenine/guanine phosphoribosyltransferase-like PRPP-binding protein
LSYLAHTHAPALADALRTIEHATVDKMDQFQYVLVTGLSGIIPGAIFAHLYGKDLVVVRKPREACHGQHVEGPYDWDSEKFDGNPGASGYIILDDFICHGHTLKRLLDVHQNGQMPEFVVMYNPRACIMLATPHLRLIPCNVPGRYTVERRKP